MYVLACQRFFRLSSLGVINYFVSADGRYDVYIAASDGAGNTQPIAFLEYWVNTVAPPAPTYLALVAGETQARVCACARVLCMCGCTCCYCVCFDCDCVRCRYPCVYLYSALF